MSGISTTSTSAKCSSISPQNVATDSSQSLPGSSGLSVDFIPQEALKLKTLLETSQDEKTIDVTVMYQEETFPEFPYEDHKNWQTIQPSGPFEQFPTQPPPYQQPIQANLQTFPTPFPKLPPLSIILPQHPVEKQSLDKPSNLLQACSSKPIILAQKPTTSQARPPQLKTLPSASKQAKNPQLFASPYQRITKPYLYLHKKHFVTTQREDDINETISLTIRRTSADNAEFDIPSPFAPKLKFGQYESLIHSMAMVCDIIDYADSIDRERFCTFFRRSILRQYERIVEPLHREAEVSKPQ